MLTGCLGGLDVVNGESIEGEGLSVDYKYCSLRLRLRTAGELTALDDARLLRKQIHSYSASISNRNH